MSDDPQLSVTRFAQRFRIEAAAALVQILRDENASPNARANAAEKILLWSSGRPGAAQPIKVDDLSSMTPEQRKSLFNALLAAYFPDFDVSEAIKAAVDAAIALMPVNPPSPPNPDFDVSEAIKAAVDAAIALMPVNPPSPPKMIRTVFPTIAARPEPEPPEASPPLPANVTPLRPQPVPEPPARTVDWSALNRSYGPVPNDASTEFAMLRARMDRLTRP